MRALGFLFAAGLVVVSGAMAETSVPETEAYSKWPASWVAAYERFDAYIAVRERYWQPANITIQEDGTLRHGVTIYKERTQHLGVEIYRDGSHALGLALDGVTNVAKGRGSIIEPGIYACVVRSSSSIGYQHHSPAYWFSVDDSAVPGAPGRVVRTVKLIPAPAAGELMWPNERMLLFSSFAVLPHRLPHELRLENNKVTPSLSLRVDGAGAVHRAILSDPGMEALLYWRVYHQGRLVERSSAAGAIMYKPTYGAGSYVVMLVIEGPRGSMPVSNVLEYPLFPEGNDRFAIIPADTDRDRLPDFLDANPEAPATGEFFIRQKDESLINPSIDRHLVRLWRDWAYAISTDPAGFRRETGFLPDAELPR